MKNELRHKERREELENLLEGGEGIDFRHSPSSSQLRVLVTEQMEAECNSETSEFFRLVRCNKPQQ